MKNTLYIFTQILVINSCCMKEYLALNEIWCLNAVHCDISMVYQTSMKIAEQYKNEQKKGKSKKN